MTLPLTFSMYKISTGRRVEIVHAMYNYCTFFGAVLFMRMLSFLDANMVGTLKIPLITFVYNIIPFASRNNNADLIKKC